MKEIIKKCDSYDKQVGCYHTFDGKCNKENCQTYNLLKENEELKKYEYYYLDKFIDLNQTLEEIRKLILNECKRCNINITSHCERCWVNNILSITNEVLK